MGVLLLATLVSGRATLPNARHSDLYPTTLGILLTIIYMAGLLFRPAREHARLSANSIVAMTIYVIGVAGLVFLPS